MQKHVMSFITQVIIASLNEKEGIGPTIKELSQTLPTSFIVVDGNSTDGTADIAKNLGAQVVFQDGRGKGDAIMKGLKHLHPQAKYVVFTDADYTYPSDSVPQMIKILEDNPKIGMVCGNRFSKHVDDNAFYGSFSIGNQLLALAHKLLNHVFLADPLTGLRVIRADVLRKWLVKSQGFDVEVELNREVRRQNFVMVEVPIRYRARMGEKKLRVKDGLPILKRILHEFACDIFAYF
jgi:dolichol-phosphate hexosyltransferase